MTDLRRTVIPMMLLGDGQVGKTSLIKRITGNIFEDSQLTTIGKESYVYQTKLHDNELKIKIWDTAGQERYRSLAKVFYKNAAVCILVYDITRRSSLDAIKNYWFKEIKENAQKDVSKINNIKIINLNF